MENSKTIEMMLNDEIIKQLGEVSDSDKCDDQKLAAISQLCDLKNNETRLRLEAEEKSQRHKDSVRENLVKTALTAAEIAIPMVFYAVWMKRGFEFEKEGTYTSSTFRTLWNRFRPTK